MRRVLAGVLCAVAVTAGCGTEEAPDNAASTPTTTASTTASTTPAAALASSGIPAPPPIDEWTVTTDSDTGVSFALPGEPKRQERPGVDGVTAAGTVYQVELDGGFGLAVSFSSAPGAEYSAAGLADIADQFVDQFHAAGAKDVQVVDRVPSEVDGHPALDFRVSFTAGTGGRSVWFVRYVGNGSEAVQLQSIAFAEPAEEAAVTEALRPYHQQLIGSLSMP